MTKQVDSASQLPFRRGQTVGHSLAYMGSIMTFLARAKETGGNCSVLSLRAQHGSEPPPHSHRDENEMFFVLEGELEVFCEGVAESLVAHPGEMILVPQGRAHALNYRSATICMLIILQSPAGRCTTETYFEAMANGPPESMQLRQGAIHYQDADPQTMMRAHRLATENGIALLSSADIGRLLPGYAALAASGDQAGSDVGP